MPLRSLALAVAALLFSSAPAAAITFGFGCLSGSAKKCLVGERQLAVEVEDDEGDVSFTFQNVGDGKLTATELYFDDNAGVLAALISSGAFEEGGSPSNLPGGKKIDFLANFLASASNPAPKNGVKPGDQVTLVFSLTDGTTLQDVIDALDGGDLRIGLKAGKSFVNVSEGGGVPEPATLALLALGAGAVVLSRRRRA